MNERSPRRFGPCGGKALFFFDDLAWKGNTSQQSTSKRDRSLPGSGRCSSGGGPHYHQVKLTKSTTIRALESAVSPQYVEPSLRLFAASLCRYEASGIQLPSVIFIFLHQNAFSVCSPVRFVNSVRLRLDAPLHVVFGPICPGTGCNGLKQLLSDR